MKYNIITEINGIKHYVRRYRESPWHTAITMVTTNKDQAKDFSTQEKASKHLSKMGIGKAIEVNK